MRASPFTGTEYWSTMILNSKVTPSSPLKKDQPQAPSDSKNMLTQYNSAISGSLKKERKLLISDIFWGKPSDCPQTPPPLDEFTP